MNETVIIACSNYYPENSASSNLVKNLANGLKNCGKNPYVVGISSKKEINIEIAVDEAINYNNIYLKYRYTKHLIWPLKFIGKIRKFKKINLIIIYGFDRPYSILPIILFCKLNKIKIIRVVTEIYVVQKKISIDSIFSLLELFQIKYFDRFLSGVIVLSDYLENLYKPIKVNKVLKIYHFIESIKYNFFRNKDKFIVTYCGSYSKNNGVEYLIQAAKILKENKYIEFRVIGDMPIKYFKEKYGELDNIEFTGKIQNKECLKRLQESSILVNPITPGIHAESGFPTKIGEYMMTGIPIINSKTGSIYNLFKNDNFITYFEPCSELDLVNHILEIFNDNDKFIERAMTAQQWAEDNLNLSKNAMRIIDEFC